MKSTRSAAAPASDTLKHLKLRHLSCALDVARMGSVRAAAEALCVTESAVSKTLRELETHLRVRLFERSAKGMTLTGAGRQFTHYAQSALHALETGVALASGNAGEPATVVRIAAMTVVSAAFLPEVVRRFLADHGDALVEIATGPGPLLLERLRTGDVSLVVGRCPPRKELAGLVFEQLYVDRHIFVVRRGHPLARVAAVAASRLAAHPIVMPPRDSPLWEDIQQYFVSRRIPAGAARVEVLDLQFSRAFTLATDGVWIASERAVAAELAAGTLVRLQVDAPSFETPVGVITPRDDAPDPRIRHLLRLMRRTGGSQA